MEAIRRAYNRMERPTHLVLLLTMKDYIRTAKDAFIQVGLNVVTYVTPDNSQDCKTFLQNPEGALITTPALFSGMEAINVILVMFKEDKRLVRSSTLRAIQQLCVVSIDSSAGELSASNGSADFAALVADVGVLLPRVADTL